MRLIDADAFLKRNEVYADCEFIHPMYQNTLREIVDEEPTIPAPRWVRCEEKPKDRQKCFVAYKGPLGFIYDSATFYDDLNSGLGEDIFEDGTSGFVMDCDVGYALTSMDYWMPIEPPREGED